MYYSDPKPLLADKKFQEFMDKDLILIIQNSMNPETITNWAKFAVYMKVEEPYVWTAITSKTRERLKKFHCDQLLAILVNAAHSLSSEATRLFDIAGAHLAQKLDRSFNPASDETFLVEEDIIKVT